MSDVLLNSEIRIALHENERAVRAAATAAHRVFEILGENTREAHAATDAARACSRELAELRSNVAALVHLEQGRQQLERDRLNLEHDKLEMVHTGEVARVDRDVAISEHRAKLLGKLFTTRGGLLLCGTVIGIFVVMLIASAAVIFGADRVQDFLSALVALLHGLRRD